MPISWRERITADPAVFVGKPVVRGTRLAVEFVLDLLAGGWSFNDVLDDYPGLTDDDIRACIGYARDLLAKRHPPGAPSPTSRLSGNASSG